MSRHRPSPTPGPPLANATAKGLVRNLLALSVANAGAGMAMLVNAPGTSAALLFLAKAAPLPVWGVGYLAAAVALLVGQPLAGHTIAVPLWIMWGVGAVLGLVSGTSPSPTGSIALAAMVVGIAAMHCAGLVYRRDERRARKEMGGS